MYINEVTQTYNRLGINSSDILQVVYNFLIFFLVTRGVRANLRAPQLIPGFTEHPVSQVNR